ncbi:hypothetical protein [Methylomusa anaerophila]
MEILNTLAFGAMISLAKLCLSGEVKFDSTILNAGLDAIWDAIKR